MKVGLIILTLSIFLSGGVGATSYLGSIVSSFNATLYVNGGRYYPMGLTYDRNELWAGYRNYVAEWMLAGSRKNMYYLNAGTTGDTAYDRTRDVLYGINTLNTVDRVVAVNPSTGSIMSSFVVPAPFTVARGLTFAGGYLYISDKNQSRILKTTRTGSVVASINPGVVAIGGLAWDGDTAGGPFLFACETDAAHTIHRINPSTGSVLDSFEGPIFTGNITGLAWDGTYLWACQNYSSEKGMYAFQFVAYDPNPGVAPASIGRIKALYR